MSDWLPFAPVRVMVKKQANGERILSNEFALSAPRDTLIDRLQHWAASDPSRPYLHEREGDDWRGLTFGETWRLVNDFAAKLVPLGLSVERPLLILAPNSINHALLALAAMRLGVPAVIGSPAYAAYDAQPGRLTNLLSVTTPGAVYLESPADRRSLGDADLPDLRLFDHAEFLLLPNAQNDDVMTAAKTVGPETVAKLLFTSGSTGEAKAVPNTHGMMCSNMDGLARVWPFLTERPPCLLDWLPWNHTFGGNFCFNIALNFGGRYYIDNGKPLPAYVGHTVANLRTVSPTIYFNVPAGFDALLPRLEADLDLTSKFFAGLHFMFNAGAAMPRSTRERLSALAQTAGTHLPPVIGSWGATETAPAATVVYFPTPYPGNLGVPMPGVEIKLVPRGDHDEIRVRGPNVMKGYWRNPAASEAAFDEDGFFRIGDAGRLADDSKPEAGILFSGRVSENFKLGSGTWIVVSKLRLDVIAAAAPLIRDVVLCGEGRDEIGLLIFPEIEACRAYCNAAPNLSDNAVLKNKGLVAAINNALDAYNDLQKGSSTKVGRFLLLEEPPTLEHGEITDKSYLNQRAVLRRRCADVERLYEQGNQVTKSSLLESQS